MVSLLWLFTLICWIAIKSNESLIQNYSQPAQDSHTYEELLLARYNGTGDSSIEYGEATYQYYLAFKELEK